jgi:hypothetical protein
VDLKAISKSMGLSLSIRSRQNSMSGQPPWT